MVVGKSSNFIEGFEDITVDSNILLNNFKQALSYTQKKQVIASPPGESKPMVMPDNETSMNTNYQSSNNKMNSKMKKNTNSMMQESMPSVPMFTNENKYNTIPTVKINSMPSEPMITNENNYNTMPTQKNESMPSKPMTTSYQSEESMPSNPMTTKSNSVNKFSNVSSYRQPLIKGSKSKFADIKNKVEDEEEEYEEKDEEENQEENEEKVDSYDENQNESDDEDSKRNNVEGFQNIEGFRGSEILQGMQLKNILLALLITFLAYLVAYAAMKNMIPIGDWFPQLKRFKNFIYWGLMYLVVYVCLEVF
jgi:hypothetical protein